MVSRSLKNKRLEENHSCPFGLTMAGISSNALGFGDPENRKKFNMASEHQNKEFSDGSGLEWYSTIFRVLDPQIGRWNQLDPKPDHSLSLYSSMGNNPITFNDRLGDTLIRKSDKKVANQMHSEFVRTKTKLSADLDRRAKITETGKDGDRKLTDKEMSQNEQEIYNLTNRIQEIENSITDLQAIRDDLNQVYKFEELSASASHGVTYVNDECEVVMSYLPGAEYFAHELHHGGGVATGRYKAVNKDGQVGLLTGLELGLFEAFAYRSQYAINPKSLRTSTSTNSSPKNFVDIDAEYVYGLVDEAGQPYYPRPKK